MVRNRVEGINTSEVIAGTLSFYYTGQSVYGGDVTVHVAGLKPEWVASQTTWTHYRSGYPWQISGAKEAIQNKLNKLPGWSWDCCSLYYA